MRNELALWQPKPAVKIPANADGPSKILPYAHQLSKRDAQQIAAAFESEHYEMVSSYIWTKAIASLKAQLGKLGTAFISEMLDRPDIDGSSSIDQVLTDYEALRLARELGTITSTGELRLRQALERHTHFGQLPAEEAEENQMTAEEAVAVVRACVENILGQERIDAALDFKEFRDRLESELLDEDDNDIENLVASPYFFQRASIRILLALVKSRTGAQLENSLGNTNVIIPMLWNRLLAPERFQVGRAYAEVTSEGKSTAASGLKKLLLKVRGFDYVPEDLRSKSFIKAAQQVLAAHDGMNNFYNEPGPTKFLDDMGSAIPPPAFSVCMTAVLSVRLGNAYGVSWAAQPHAVSILERVSRDRWAYYLNECFKTDDRILYKLLGDSPVRRWIELVKEFGLLKASSHHVNDSTVKQLIADAAEDRANRVQALASKLINKLGLKGR